MKYIAFVVVIGWTALGHTNLYSSQEQIAKILAADGRPGEEFGTSNDVSGGTLFVGAPDAGPVIERQGAAYVFERDDNGTPGNPKDDRWEQIDRLLASDAGYQQFFGGVVTVEADTAVIGARFAEGAQFASGAAYVFERDDQGTPGNPFDDSWIETRKIFASDGETNDNFSAVCLEGNTLFVGANGDDDLNSNAGAVYVFERDDKGTPGDRFDDDWVEVTKILADDTSTGSFGNLAAQGSSLVVGARFGSGAAPDSGAAYVFERDDSGTATDPFDDGWIQTAKLTASDARPTGNFGVTVCIFGDTILVSSIGTAYTFERDDAATPSNPFDDDWIETFKLLPGGPLISAQFGISAFIGDGLALVGDNIAPGSGAAYLFHRENHCTPGDPFDDTWVHVGLLAAADAPAPNFGVACRIAGDVAFVGSLDAQGATGNTGAVYVYELSDFDCVQQYCIDFELEDDDVTPLSNGQDVSPSEEFGRRVTVGGTSSAGLSSAIFDSRPWGPNATSQDQDLLVDLGNVLIAQELPGQSSPGFFDFPDDDRFGGDLVIEFLDSPVRVLSVDLVDIDDLPGQLATLVLVDRAGLERTFLVRPGWTEDLMVDGPPGYGTLEFGTLRVQRGFLSFATSTEDAGFDPASVVRLRVHFDGSAAIDNLRYCVGPPAVRGRVPRQVSIPSSGLRSVSLGR